MALNGVEIVTPVGVAIYPALVEKESYQDSEPKYKLTVVFPESVLADPKYPKQRDRMAAMLKAVSDMKAAHKGKLGLCVKKVGAASDDNDGTEDPLLEHFPAGTVYLRTTSKFAVSTVGTGQQPIDPGDIYSGCHVRVSGKLLIAVKYGKLICGLGAVQLAAKKEAISVGGGGNAAKAFEGDPLPDDGAVAPDNSLFD